MKDISGFGLSVTLIASETFPVGITITEFADDADPFDTPSRQISDVAMGLNGDLVSWKTPNIYQLTLNVIPNSESDKNLAMLAFTNSIGKNKSPVNDIISAVVSYPDGKTTKYINGTLTDAMDENSVGSSGRLKSKTYIFKFEDRV